MIIIIITIKRGRQLKADIESQQTRRYWYNIVPITFQVYVVFGQKTCIYTIFEGIRKFAQRANTWDFVGPFTTSCEARARIIFSKRRADTVIGGST